MKKIAVILFLLQTLMVPAQILQDSTFHIECTATASPLISFFRNERYPGAPDKLVVGYGITLRGMWHPPRLLAVGFLTGYIFIVHDELPSSGNGQVQLPVRRSSARLTAIPLQLAVTMQKAGLEIGTGMGPYLLVSTIDDGAPAQGRRIELGLTFFGSYVFSLGDGFFLGPELRVLYLAYRGILSVMPSLSIRFEPYKYVY